MPDGRPFFIVLGAGKPFSGIQHSALRNFGGNSRVLDWALNALSQMSPELVFVCGYQAKQVRENYPNFHYVTNLEWKDTRSGWSLLIGLPRENRETFVSYADTLFRPSVVKKMIKVKKDVVIAVDKLWLDRYSGRKKSDLEQCEKVSLSGNAITHLSSAMPIADATAEFIGFVKLSPKAVIFLRDLLKNSHINIGWLKQATLLDMLGLLLSNGFDVGAVDVCGDWAELNESADLAKFILGTKGQSLSRLKDLLTLSQIQDLVSFDVHSWRRNPSGCVEKIQSRLACESVVVRSSALNEDGFSNSHAGAYTSLLNINQRDKKSLISAVERVVSSYEDENLENEILVQPMLTNIVASGVIFSRTLLKGAPYYVVNYDDITGKTDSITSGRSREHKTLFIRRDARVENTQIPPCLAGLLPAVREIESLLGYDRLDIEFAVNEGREFNIFQVRPITVNSDFGTDDDARIFAMLDYAEKAFEEKQVCSPSVVGRRALFGVMPDWNPAEIIGTKPRRLAISLYRMLITDETWATQRAEYGYRDLSSNPLMTTFAGHPYVDVRASFNSFIPVELPDALAERVVNFCLDWLESHPELHDKVEFEVIPTCLSLDFERWENRFTEFAGLEEDEIVIWRKALKRITKRALGRNNNDLASIATLEKRYNTIVSDVSLPLDRAFALLHDARQHGTLSFSHLARSAFVAVTLLRSAVTTKVLSQTAVDAFLRSIRTVGHDFTGDAQKCASGKISWEDFIERYGHLRPGTYEISSQCYRNDPEYYLRPVVEEVLNHKTEVRDDHDGDAWLIERSAFANKLNAIGISCTEESIDTFLRESIEGREYAKFAFTRNLSSALDAICEWGEGLSVDPHLLSEVSIADLSAIHRGQISSVKAHAWLLEKANASRQRRNIIEAIELPPLLCSKDNFVVFQHPISQANYIGNKAIVAQCLDFRNGSRNWNLRGKIVLIPQADPGHDWIFGRHIGGLITMHGGANSHMAIRAAEFSIPAAIGVGELRYSELSAAKKVELDPINRLVRILH